MMLNLKTTEQVFLNSDIYLNFRSLICSERIFLANVYLRFNNIDLRPLLAGCLVCKWDEDEKMFMPERNYLNEKLTSAGALKIKRPDKIQDLKNFVSHLHPNKNLLIAQQGALVNGQKLYTDMCIYNNGEKNLTSIIREGLEGFSFELEQAHYEAHQLAFDKNIKIIHSEALEDIFKDKKNLFNELKDLHNESIKKDLFKISQIMKIHVNENISISIDYPEQLPTFLALKLCGPICWYFNRFIQSCLGLQSLYPCFDANQLSLIESINTNSAKTRNMGLKLSRSQKDKDRIALEKLINHLIDQIESLESLFIV